MLPHNKGKQPGIMRSIGGGNHDLSGGMNRRPVVLIINRRRAFGFMAWLLALVAGCSQPTWEATMQAGEAAMQRGNYAEAERIFAVAVTRAEEAGLQDRRVAVTLSRLAQAYSSQGKYVEAEPVYLRALEIYQTVHGEEHLDVAATLNNLGVIHRMHGQYADAQRLLMRALHIKEKVLGTDHLDVALGLTNLATMYVSQGHYDQAAPLFRRAISIRETQLGSDHPDVAKTLEEYAALLRKSDQSAAAADVEMRAKAIRAKPPS